MKRLIPACVAGLFLALAGLAGAQSTPDSTPPSPALEKIVTVDAAVSSKVYNELSPGNSAGVLDVRGFVELPAVLGHGLMLQGEWQQWRYQHAAGGGFAAGIVQNCPGTNPGCVLPIGYKTYDANLAVPVELYVPAFNAVDTESHLGVSLKISSDQRYYVGAGYLFRSFNYLNYPAQNGFGVGLDKLPDLDRQLSFYGSFWDYADVAGTYTGPSSALLGAFSGASFKVEYRMFTYRVGGTYAFANGPFFLDLNYAGDRADIRNNAPSDISHSAVSLGVGAHF
jgi:hypothetical protein